MRMGENGWPDLRMWFGHQLIGSELSDATPAKRPRVTLEDCQLRRAVEEILTESADDDYEGDPGCFGGENRAAPIPESSLGWIFGTTNVSGTWGETTCATC